MKRRVLFKRLGTIAAAVALAPAVKAEAVPVEADQIKVLVDDVLANPGKHSEIEACAQELMGLIPGTPYPVAMIQGMQPPLTFEAMAADCAARGCALEGWLTLDYDPPQYRAVHAASARLDPDEPHVWFSIDHDAPYRLERLDEWRRSLHEQTGVAPLIDRAWEAEVLAAGNAGDIIRIPDRV